jgi:hypothetical protein
MSSKTPTPGGTSGTERRAMSSNEDTTEDERTFGMTPAEFLAHRLDVWDFARDRLLGGPTCAQPAPKFGDYQVDPADILILAAYLDGDNLDTGASE